MNAEQLQESYRKSNETWLDRLTAACGNDLTSEQKEAKLTAKGKRTLRESGYGSDRCHEKKEWLPPMIKI